MGRAMGEAEVDAGDGSGPKGSGAREALLEQLTFECLERIECEGPEVVEELCRGHVELAHELLERIGALVRRGLIDVPPPAGLGPDAPPPR